MRIYYENYDYNIRIFEEEGFSFPQAHWHTKVEIAVVLEGSIIVGVNNDKRLLTKGDAVALGSGDIHYYDGREHKAKMMILIFKPELINTSTRWPKEKRFVNNFILKDTMPFEERDDIVKLLFLLKDVVNPAEEAGLLFMKSHLYYICAILLKYLPVVTIDHTSGDKVLMKLKLQQDIFSYIEDNYMNDITVESLAKHFHISTKYFSKIFNSISGDNFKTHINSIRIGHAENMIMEGNENFAEIAFACGFNSVRTFNRAFITIRKITPSKFKEMMLGKTMEQIEIQFMKENAGSIA